MSKPLNKSVESFQKFCKGFTRPLLFLHVIVSLSEGGAGVGNQGPFWRRCGDGVAPRDRAPPADRGRPSQSRAPSHHATPPPKGALDRHPLPFDFVTVCAPNPTRPVMPLTRLAFYRGEVVVGRRNTVLRVLLPRCCLRAGRAGGGGCVCGRGCGDDGASHAPRRGYHNVVEWHGMALRDGAAWRVAWCALTLRVGHSASPRVRAVLWCLETRWTRTRSLSTHTLMRGWRRWRR